MEHDIRTPLAGIYGMAEMLCGTTREPETKKDLQEFVICAKQLITHCDGILDFSNIESGLPVIEKPFNPRELVDEIMLIERVPAKSKNLDLSLVYDKKLPNVLIGDPYRFKRILLNLAGNALKFTAEGFVKIKISQDSIDEKEQRINLLLEVEDTGCGVPEDKEEMIFERFNKVVPSNKEHYKGLGLGLTIVKRFVEELKGHIVLNTKLNKGSLFRVYLPLKMPLFKHLKLNVRFGAETLVEASKQESTESEPFSVPEKSSPNLKIDGNIRVLLVEDNIMAQKINHSVLEMSGCRVDIADTGEKAIDFANQNHYELIMMDLGLPGINGFEAAETILKNSKNKNTPILALTAHTDDKTRKDCQISGMKGVFNKPLLVETLREILEIHLESTSENSGSV